MNVGGVEFHNSSHIITYLIANVNGCTKVCIKYKMVSNQNDL